MSKGLLIILSGPSGVGKGTVRKVLMQDTALNLVYSISMTTRKIRSGETEGVEYFFVNKRQFNQAIKNEELLEYAKFVNNYYGTPKAYVEKLRNEGKNVLLEIETRGARQIIEKLKDDQGLVSIFLIPPSFEDLEKRMRGRNSESDHVVKERLERAKRELALKDIYDHVVCNDSPANAALKISEIIKNKI